MPKRIIPFAIFLLVGMTSAASADPISGSIIAFVGLGGLGAVTTVATAALDIGLSIGCHVRGHVLRASK